MFSPELFDELLLHVCVVDLASLDDEPAAKVIKLFTAVSYEFT
jgi:hypothetical protein